MHAWSEQNSNRLRETDAADEFGFTLVIGSIFAASHSFTFSHSDVRWFENHESFRTCCVHRELFLIFWYIWDYFGFWTRLQQPFSSNLFLHVRTLGICDVVDQPRIEITSEVHNVKITNKANYFVSFTTTKEPRLCKILGLYKQAYKNISNKEETKTDLSFTNLSSSDEM